MYVYCFWIYKLLPSDKERKKTAIIKGWKDSSEDKLRLRHTYIHMHQSVEHSTINMRRKGFKFNAALKREKTKKWWQLEREMLYKI